MKQILVLSVLLAVLVVALGSMGDDGGNDDPIHTVQPPPPTEQPIHTTQPQYTMEPIRTVQPPFSRQP